MRTLVFESDQVKQFPATAQDASSAFVTVASPYLRPRIQGNETELAGDAVRAIVVDRGVVTFVVRPAAAATFAGSYYYPTTAQLLAYLTIRTLRADGTTSEATFPYPERDVSAMIQAGFGRLEVRIPHAGVCQVQLRLGAFTQNEGRIAPMMVTTEVFGDILPDDWEAERTDKAVP